jgi:hypothetical protein
MCREERGGRGRGERGPQKLVILLFFKLGDECMDFFFFCTREMLYHLSHAPVFLRQGLINFAQAGFELVLLLPLPPR